MGKQISRRRFVAAASASAASLLWHEVSKVQHYRPSVDAMRRPMRVRDDRPEYGAETWAW